MSRLYIKLYRSCEKVFGEKRPSVSAMLRRVYSRKLGTGTRTIVAGLVLNSSYNQGIMPSMSAAMAPHGTTQNDLQRSRKHRYPKVETLHSTLSRFRFKVLQGVGCRVHGSGFGISQTYTDSSLWTTVLL